MALKRSPSCCSVGVEEAAKKGNRKGKEEGGRRWRKVEGGSREEEEEGERIAY